MAKRDIKDAVRAVDELLATTTSPRHRQILENYRRHVILEICGEWEAIMDPEMTVEHPTYYLNVAGRMGTVLEGDMVREFYAGLTAASATIILAENERLMVSDWGFTSDSVFNSYSTGQALQARGVPVGNPDGYYILKQGIVMVWPYDESGRMIGEHVYENQAIRELVEIPAEDFLTIDDAREYLLPMLRPLPVAA
jgi:hypothetical protein